MSAETTRLPGEDFRDAARHDHEPTEPCGETCPVRRERASGQAAQDAERAERFQVEKARLRALVHQHEDSAISAVASTPDVAIAHSLIARNLRDRYRSASNIGPEYAV